MALTALDHQQAFADVIARLAAWGLPADDVSYTLSGAVQAAELQARETLFVQDSPVEAVYVLVSGRVFQDRIVEDAQGQRRVVLRRETGPGELIGHYDLLYNQEYSTRARAIEPCRLIAVGASALNRLIYRFPAFRNRIAPIDTIGRLRTVPLFGRLEMTPLSYIAEVARAEKVPAGRKIFGADQPADSIYVIDTGQVKLTWPDGTNRWVGNGMEFGYLDGIFNNPPPDGDYLYGYEAVAASDTSLFVFSRRQVIELAGVNPEKAGHQFRQLRESTLQNLPLFSRYTDDERRMLIGYMGHVFVPIHHLVMQQGEMGDSLWVLLPGSRATLRALEAGSMGGRALQPTLVYGPNFFSELALLVQHPLDSTVQAEPNSHWLRLHYGDFFNFADRAGEDVAGEDLIDRLVMNPAAERLLGQERTRQRYSWLEHGERLIIFERRHWIVLLRKTWPALLLLLLLGVLSFFTWERLVEVAWARAIFSLIGFGGIVSLVWGIVDYLNDFLLLTNERLVRQEKVVFVTEYRQAALLEQVRSVDVTTSLIGASLNYGDLKVQTAAGEPLRFDFVRDPHRIRDLILEQQDLRKRHYQASSKMVIQTILEDRLGLRLRFPVRVAPESQPVDEPVQSGWWNRIRAWLRRRSMPKRIEDKITWRKHWFVLAGHLLTPATLLALTMLLALGQHLLPDPLDQIAAPLDVLWVLIGLSMISWIAWEVADWRNDIYMVDAREITDVEKKPLFFSEQRRTALLGEIENIEVSIPSPLHFVLNFGKVHLYTAATQGHFTFDWVPDPRGVSEEIRRRVELYRRQQETDRARLRAQELPDWFEMYNRLDADAARQSG